MSRPGPGRPLVSVIMPVYNAAPVLARAVDSVLAQTLDDWELILVDDASTDASRAAIKTVTRRDPRISALFHPHNTGAAAARNTGIAQARGRYIAFMDADDEWLADKLNRQITLMAECNVALGYTGFWRVNGAARRRVRVPATVTRDILLRGNVIGCLTAVYDRDILGTVAMPDLPLSHDYALWLDLLARIDHAVGLDEPMAVYHRSSTSLSGSRFRSLAGTWQVYRQHLGLPRWQAARNLTHHILQRARQEG